MELRNARSFWPKAALGLALIALAVFVLWQAEEDVVDKKRGDRLSQELDVLTNKVERLSAWLNDAHQALRQQQTGSRYWYPYFSLPEDGVVPGTAHCDGPGDGLGTALVSEGDLVLGPGADLRMLSEAEDGTQMSLRQVLEQMAQRLPTGQDTACNLWPRHPVERAWVRQQSLEESIFFCTSDLVGETCQWRTDWSIPSCALQLDGFCACPSSVTFGSLVSTRYYFGMPTSYFMANWTWLCADAPPARNATPFPLLPAERFSPCSKRLDSYCSERHLHTITTLRRSSTLLWPPASYPMSSLDGVFAMRTALRVRMTVDNCEGHRGWLSSVGNDGWLFSCQWKLALTFTSSAYTPAQFKEPLWARYGIAFRLTDESSGTEIVDLCLNGTRLFNCEEPGAVLCYADSRQAMFTTACSHEARVAIVADDLY